MTTASLRPRALAGPGLGRRAAPFLGLLLLAFVVVALPSVEEREWALTASGVLTGGLVTAGMLLPWRRLPPWTEVLVPLGFAVVLFLLRESRGGATSG